ncbi:MAG TPA: YwhD family protein, partial [Savagea sp.]
MSNKKMSFTIIKDDPTDGHKGFGIGSISLENVTPLFIDVQEEEAYIEVGAMHARGP